MQRRARKTLFRSFLPWLGLLIAGLTGGPASAADTTGFSMSYSSYGTTYGISGREPAAAGRYPVYIHIGGTGEPYQSNWSLAAVNTAAAKGFVAASVQYDNTSFGDCSVIGSRARAIFDARNLQSAIAQVCSRGKADCSKGVVTGGLSQGSIISVLAHDYDSRVVASFGQGTGATYTPTTTSAAASPTATTRCPATGCASSMASATCSSAATRASPATRPRW